MTLILIVVYCILYCLRQGFFLDDGLARKPPMGWMSWGYFMCETDCEKKPDKCLNEDLIISVADEFYKGGYLAAGYEYIIIDDCWSEKRRDHRGRLVADRKRFPNGMKFLADYIHSYGLKFGMYTNIADVTCMRYPGSRDHFEEDIKTFVEWEIDYLKVDGCFVEEDFLNVAYIDIGSHIKENGRPIVYSCSWPYYLQFIHNKAPNYSYISEHCHLWRNYHDIIFKNDTSWVAIQNVIWYYEDIYHELVKHHGPGGWNDPDMLVSGSGLLTNGQSRVQLSVYAMLSAPLLISCNMKTITPFEKGLLQNMELLSIDQDDFGIMAKPHKIIPGSVTLWVKARQPLKGNKYESVSFALINLGSIDHTIYFTPSEYGLNATDGYSVLDVFSGRHLKNVSLSDTISMTAKYEDAIVYTLYPV